MLNKNQDIKKSFAITLFTYQDLNAFSITNKYISVFVLIS